MRIAINGFGRIGRLVLRALWQRHWPQALQLVAVNDLASPESLLHLLRYDSVHGRLTAPLALVDGALQINGGSLPFFRIDQRQQLPWQDLAVDLVLDCSGGLKNRAQACEHIEAGANRVLVSAPMADADITVVYGVNHQHLRSDYRIISNASCTTNCLAPIVQLLNQHFGIEQGMMTTVHAYTNDQSLLDNAGDDLYRSRAAALSIIPTKTGAAQAVGLVLPELAGKLDGMALRVPTADVSAVDFHCLLQREASVEQVNQLMRKASEGALQGVLDYCDQPLVSVDFCHNQASAIFDAGHTAVVGKQLKVLAWYDNEWGFANRLIDMALYLQQL